MAEIILFNNALTAAYKAPSTKKKVFFSFIHFFLYGSRMDREQYSMCKNGLKGTWYIAN